MTKPDQLPANPANAMSVRFFASVGIGAGARVLDVGCGDGDLSRVVAKLAGPTGEVVAIDRSEAALALADAVVPDSASAPVRYRQADLAGRLPDLGSFDAIVGRRVLMYLPEARRTLARLATLARRRAVIAFQEHARADLPSGLGDLPLHRKMYDWAWRTVAAEGGDARLGLRLAGMLRAVGRVDQARAEAVLLEAGTPSFLPMLARMMRPRIVEHGIATPNEVEALAAGIDAELRNGGATVVWDLAFLVSTRVADR